MKSWAAGDYISMSVLPPGLKTTKKDKHNSGIGIGLEEVWIASNAAIGGPATAAAFVMNCMKGKTVQDDELLQGRTIAATVWGVVGYAVGTMLGVAMYKLTGPSTITI